MLTLGPFFREFSHCQQGQADRAAFLDSHHEDARFLVHAHMKVNNITASYFAKK
jgi:hypothetical protein